MAKELILCLIKLVFFKKYIQQPGATDKYTFVHCQNTFVFCQYTFLYFIYPTIVKTAIEYHISNMVIVNLHSLPSTLKMLFLLPSPPMLLLLS